MVNTDPTADIARRVRAEREARGWSLGELARRSGVSKAMISKLERVETSPSAATLGRLSAAFGVTLATLLARAEDSAGRLARRAEQPRWRDPATGYLRRQVHARGGSPLELAEVQLPARKSVSFPAAAYRLVHQVVWLRRGRLDVSEGGHLHRLDAGDCLELGAPSRVTFRNPGRTSCEYVVALVRR